MENKNKEIQIAWNFEENNDDEQITFDIPVTNKAVTPSPLAENYRQSNWLTPTIMSMNTYSNRIFQGILSAWNMKYIQRGDVADRWAIENINKMDCQIHFKVNELFKEISDNKEMNYKSADRAIVEFNKKSHIQLSSRLKDEAPEVYEAILKIASLKSGNTEIDFADIPMFSIYRNHGADSIYTFEVNKVLVPIFDSITKYFTSLNLKSIQKLNNNNLKLYEYFKQRLGSDTAFEFIMYFEPTPENQFDNMRYILNAHETDSKGNFIKYPNRSDDLFKKTFLSNLETLNKTCSDLFIEYKTSDGKLDKNRYILKNRKRIGFKLTLHSFNTELNKSNNATGEERKTQLSYYKRLQALYPNSTFLKEWENYKDNDYVFKPIYNILEGDKFKNKHYDSMIMNDNNWANFKSAYLDFCYEFMQAEYYNFEVSKLECNQFKMMNFFLSHGANIYDAMVFQKQHILSWTPDKDVEKYGTHKYFYTKKELESGAYKNQSNLSVAQLDMIKKFIESIN